MPAHTQALPTRKPCPAALYSHATRAHCQQGRSGWGLLCRRRRLLGGGRSCRSGHRRCRGGGGRSSKAEPTEQVIVVPQVKDRWRGRGGCCRRRRRRRRRHRARRRPARLLLLCFRRRVCWCRWQLGLLLLLRLGQHPVGGELQLSLQLLHLAANWVQMQGPGPGKRQKCGAKQSGTQACSAPSSRAPGLAGSTARRPPRTCATRPRCRR